MGLNERQSPRPEPLPPSALAIEQMRLDLMSESLAIAAHYAHVAQLHADAGDAAVALWSLGNFRRAALQACQCGGEIRKAREGATPASEVEVDR